MIKGLLAGMMGLVFFTMVGHAQVTKGKVLPCIKADLVLIFDRSDSVGDEEQDALILVAVNDLANRYELSKDTLQIGIGVFTAVPAVLADITWNKQKIADAVGGFPSSSGNTNISAGFDAAETMFLDQLRSTENAGRVDAKKVMVIFSDGISEAYESAAQISQRLKDGSWIFDYDQNVRLNEVTVYVVNTSADKSNKNREALLGLASGPEYYTELEYGQIFGYLEKLNICG